MRGYNAPPPPPPPPPAILLAVSSVGHSRSSRAFNNCPSVAELSDVAKVSMVDASLAICRRPVLIPLPTLAWLPSPSLPLPSS